MSNIKEHRDALMDLIVVADDVVAKKREELQALRDSRSDSAAIAATEREINKLMSAVERIRPFAD
jgi:hypothetical protein